MVLLTLIIFMETIFGVEVMVLAKNELSVYDNTYFMVELFQLEFIFGENNSELPQRVQPQIQICNIPVFDSYCSFPNLQII